MPSAVVLQVLLAGARLVVTPLRVAAQTASAPADLPLTPLVVALVLLQLGPLAGGSVLRARRQALAAAVHRAARTVADVALAVLVVGLPAAQADQHDRVGGKACP